MDDALTSVVSRPMSLRNLLIPTNTTAIRTNPQIGVPVKVENEPAANPTRREITARIISDAYHCAVLLKGGHSVSDANDLLYEKGSYKWFCGKRIDNPNTHGTGCTLSSAIASNLAKGYDLESSVQRAKDYISGALAAMLDLGQGSGPMNHAFDLNSHFAK